MKSCLPLEPSKTHHQLIHNNHIETQSFLSYDHHHHYQESDGKKITDLKCIPSKTPTLPVLRQAGDDAMKVVREEQLLQDDCGRERLKRHRIEAAGRVWIPDIWGHEELLKDWIDCSVFEASLMPNRIMSARAALVEQGRRRASCTPGRLRIENRR
ncbi:hypothetical protein P3X46_004195 [Hevea brasiliensis]|nr:hypothetical protein P3X46_004195 [Hevea brasiliensis]